MFIKTLPSHRDINMFAAPTEAELLKLAGGDLSMVQTTGKAGGELRTILAQRVSVWWCVLAFICFVWIYEYDVSRSVSFLFIFCLLVTEICILNFRPFTSVSA